MPVFFPDPQQYIDNVKTQYNTTHHNTSQHITTHHNTSQHITTHHKNPRSSHISALSKLKYGMAGMVCSQGAYVNGLEPKRKDPEAGLNAKAGAKAKAAIEKGKVDEYLQKLELADRSQENILTIQEIAALESNTIGQDQSFSPSSVVVDAPSPVVDDESFIKSDPRRGHRTTFTGLREKNGKLVAPRIQPPRQSPPKARQWKPDEFGHKPKGKGSFLETDIDDIESDSNEKGVDAVVLEEDM